MFVVLRILCTRFASEMTVQKMHVFIMNLLLLGMTLKVQVLVWLYITSLRCSIDEENLWQGSEAK